MSTLTVGQKIRKARRDLDMTQEDLAKKIGTTKATINKYELGVVTNIPRSKLQAIAEALNISPEEFFDYSVTLNTLRQQLNNIDSDLHILEQEFNYAQGEDYSNKRKKFDSLIIKREHVKADIYRLEALVKLEQEAEVAAAKTEHITRETKEPFTAPETAETPAAEEPKTTDEEKELLRIYKKLSVRRRMQLLGQAYALEDEEG